MNFTSIWTRCLRLRLLVALRAVAVATFADNSRHASPWAAAIYQAALDRGADHPHAIRILARAWIRVIYRCWVDHVAYDQSRHGAAKQLDTVGSAVSSVLLIARGPDVYTMSVSSIPL